MIDPVQAAVGIIVLLITVGALLWIFYSRTNAVEKTGYGTLLMLLIVSLMIPVFWIMEGNGAAQAKIQQHNSDVAQGAALYAKYCFQCHGLLGQGQSGPKLNGSDPVSKLSDADLIRIISSGIPKDPGTLSNLAGTQLAMPAWSDQFGGPLSQPQIQFLFELIRSSDPNYLHTNGFADGPGSNGFTQVPDALKSQNADTYKSAVATATAFAGTGQFGPAKDMTATNKVTIDIVNTLAGCTSTPACFGIPNIKVKVGTTITWVNQSSSPHTVVAIKGLNPGAPVANPQVFDSTTQAGGGILAAGTGTFTYTVTMAAYNANPGHQVIYYCSIHPGMTAMITVVP